MSMSGREQACLAEVYELFSNMHRHERDEVVRALFAIASTSVGHALFAKHNRLAVAMRNLSDAIDADMFGVKEEKK